MGCILTNQVESNQKKTTFVTLHQVNYLQEIRAIYVNISTYNMGTSYGYSKFMLISSDGATFAGG